MAAMWETINEGDVLPELRKRPGVTQLVKYAAGSGDFSGGEQGAAKVLQEKGFDVAVNEVEAAAEELRAARRPARAAATSTRTPTARRASGDRATAPEKVTASRPKPRKTAAAAPVLKICPTCNMALPASGICDFCD